MSPIPFRNSAPHAGGGALILHPARGEPSGSMTVGLGGAASSEVMPATSTVRAGRVMRRGVVHQTSARKDGAEISTGECVRRRVRAGDG
jgi:hypothetical protein